MRSYCYAAAIILYAFFILGCGSEARELTLDQRLSEAQAKHALVGKAGVDSLIFKRGNVGIWVRQLPDNSVTMKGSHFAAVFVFRDKSLIGTMDSDTSSLSYRPRLDENRDGVMFITTYTFDPEPDVNNPRYIVHVATISDKKLVTQIEEKFDVSVQRDGLRGIRLFSLVQGVSVADSLMEFAVFAPDEGHSASIAAKRSWMWDTEKSAFSMVGPQAPKVGQQ